MSVLPREEKFNGRTPKARVELDNHGEYRLQYGKKTADFAAFKSLGARARADQGQVIEMEVYKCRYCSEVKASMVEMEMHEPRNHGRDGVEQEESKRKILNLDSFFYYCTAFPIICTVLIFLGTFQIYIPYYLKK